MAYTTTAIAAPQSATARELRIIHSQKTSELLVGTVHQYRGHDQTGEVREYVNNEPTGNYIRFEKFKIHNNETGEFVTLVCFADQDPVLVEHCDNLKIGDQVHLIVYQTTSRGTFIGNRKIKALTSKQAVEAARVGRQVARSPLARMASSVDPDEADQELAKALTASTSHAWKTFANKATAYLPR